MSAETDAFLKDLPFQVCPHLPPGMIVFGQLPSCQMCEAERAEVEDQL